MLIACLIFCSATGYEAPGTYCYWHTWYNVGLVHQVQVHRPQEDQGFCAGWGWCHDCNTGTPGPEYSNPEVSRYYQIVVTVNLYWLKLLRCIFHAFLQSSRGANIQIFNILQMWNKVMHLFTYVGQSYCITLRCHQTITLSVVIIIYDTNCTSLKSLSFCPLIPYLPVLVCF